LVESRQAVSGFSDMDLLPFSVESRLACQVFQTWPPSLFGWLATGRVKFSRHRLPSFLVGSRLTRSGLAKFFRHDKAFHFGTEQVTQTRVLRP
jgi:hypothetical protein